MIDPDLNLMAEGTSDKMAIALLPEAPLSWLAFGLETSIQWFLSRSVFALEFERKDRYYDSMNGVAKILILTRPLVPTSEGIEFSNITPFKELLRARVLAPSLREKWNPTGPGTLVDLKVRNTDVSIGLFAFIVSDSVTELFLRGATVVRVQVSFTEYQLWGNTTLTGQQFADLMDINKAAYDPHDPIATLPWPISC